jgi:hypothetical protein
MDRLTIREIAVLRIVGADRLKLYEYFFPDKQFIDRESVAGFYPGNAPGMDI